MVFKTFEDPVKLRFYIERYEKENRLTRVRETFTPGPRVKPLTSKFYAKHDVLSPLDVRQEDVDLIKRQTELTPKEIYSFKPPAINMEYGWFSVLLVPLSTDPRLRFPRRQVDFIANEIQNRKARRGLPEKRFVGVPFKT